jgi:beta-phosphoglucomutase-like phosphatase (HAD superfamily)
MTTFRAAILDFDGLILETEGTGYASWRAIFQERGVEYTLDEYRELAGSSRTAHEHFEARCGRPEDWSALDRRRREIEVQLQRSLTVQPGVESLLNQARALGLRTGVASSSSHQWVDPLLEAHGLLQRFDTIVCREDAAHPKPEPDLYREAMYRLAAPAEAAVAFEDSEVGALAARRAGMWCVVVPTPVTVAQDFSHAHVVLPTLERVDLCALLAGFAR